MLSGHLTAESDIYSISGPSLQASDVVPTMARDDSSLIRHRGLMEWNSGAFDFLPIPMTTSTRNSRLRRNPSRQYQSGHPVASHADSLELACGRWRRRRHERAPTRQPNKQNPKLRELLAFAFAFVRLYPFRASSARDLPSVIHAMQKDESNLLNQKRMLPQTVTQVI
jgi:hypothetical protein